MCVLGKNDIREYGHAIQCVLTMLAVLVCPGCFGVKQKAVFSLSRNKCALIFLW